uniref:Uncharacterized protein n=1 Tax=Leptocylindrus danicus TaxID=163516 RepID=A0A7S2L756_9STRA|mmetsp:Transcript_32777/g.47440  ORF Transcript_32777/g.47440 Transcript_32777/m.47440 type:complete len:678 (+) Transcript_32777:2-2035(+)
MATTTAETILFPTDNSYSDDSSYAPSSDEEDEEDHLLRYDSKDDLFDEMYDVEAHLLRTLLREEGVPEDMISEMVNEAIRERAALRNFPYEEGDDESASSGGSSVTLGEASFNSCPSLDVEDLKSNFEYVEPLLMLIQQGRYGHAINMINENQHMATVYFKFSFLRYDTSAQRKKSYAVGGTLLHYFCSRYQLIPVEVFQAVLKANPQAALMRGSFLQQQPSKAFYAGNFTPLHMLCRNIRLNLLEEMEHRQLVFIKEIVRACPHATKVSDSVFHWLPLHELCAMIFRRPRNLELKVEVLGEVLEASGLDALKLNVRLKAESEGVLDHDAILVPDNVDMDPDVDPDVLPLYAVNHNRYAIELLLGLCDPLYSGRFELDKSAEPFFAQCVSMLVECDVEPNPVSVAQCNALYYACTNFLDFPELTAFIFKVLFKHDLYPSLKRLYDNGNESVLSSVLKRYKFNIEPFMLKALLATCPFQLLIPGKETEKTPFTVFQELYNDAIASNGGEGYQGLVARMSENLKVITFGAVRAFCPIEVHEWTLYHFSHEPFDDNNDSLLINAIKANRTQLKEHFWWKMGQSDPSKQVEFILSKYPSSAGIPDANGKLPLTIAIEYFETNGLSYEVGVKTIADCAPNAIRTRDLVTHLYPFMSATLAGDTSLTFELLRRYPDVVKLVLV